MTSAPAKVVALLCGALIALWLPFLMSSYGLRLLDLSLISAIAVLGLCFAFGYAGLLHLGQAAFVGIGAYTSALAATRMGLEFWFSMPIAIALTMIVGIGIGVPMLRLRGHYLALATVGFNVTVDIIARNWTDVTGGENGLSCYPKHRYLGLPLRFRSALLLSGPRSFGHRMPGRFCHPPFAVRPRHDCGARR